MLPNVELLNEDVKQFDIIIQIFFSKTLKSNRLIFQTKSYLLKMKNAQTLRLKK